MLENGGKKCRFPNGMITKMIYDFLNYKGRKDE